MLLWISGFFLVTITETFPSETHSIQKDNHDRIVNVGITKTEYPQQPEFSGWNSNLRWNLGFYEKKNADCWVGLYDTAHK